MPKTTFTEPILLIFQPRLLICDYFLEKKNIYRNLLRIILKLSMYTDTQTDRQTIFFAFSNSLSSLVLLSTARISQCYIVSIKFLDPRFRRTCLKIEMFSADLLSNITALLFIVNEIFS